MKIIRLFLTLCVISFMVMSCKPAPLPPHEDDPQQEVEDPENPDDPGTPDEPEDPAFEPGSGNAGEIAGDADAEPVEGAWEFADESDKEKYCRVYPLPDPLVFSDGTRVQNASEWTGRRRGEIIEIFASQMFGHIPPAPEGLHFKELSSDSTVYDGIGTRSTIRIFLDASEEHWFDAMLHLPNNVAKAPVFVFLNHVGNDLTLTTQKKRWPYEMILKNGFGVITAYHDEIDPDPDPAAGEALTGFTRGVRSWYAKDCDWAAISAWAWGMSRMVDYLETNPRVDNSRIISVGHSRTGKTSLWAGANDSRYAMVIANGSGCCGAAISRKPDGGNFYKSAMNQYYYHWFTPQFYTYYNDADSFPGDQHWVAALTAPRPLYFGCGNEDKACDPILEWITAVRVEPVFKLFGENGLSLGRYPGVDEADDKGFVGYHRRAGGHDVKDFDWTQYMKFVNHHLSK